MSEDGYRNLADAIIMQAVSDYRREARKQVKHPHDVDTAQKKLNIERFFLSGWFTMLCTLDGRRLLRDLDRQLEITEVVK